MSIRVGESWTARNGHRRWVSFPLHDLLALGLLGAWLIVPLWFAWVLWKVFLAELWLAAECALILATSLLAAIALARHEARLSDVTLSRLRFGLWMVDVR